MMRKVVKNIFHNIVLNDFSWAILKPLIFLSDRIKAAREFRRKEPLISQYTKIAHERLSGNIVRHGPFKGMQYHTSVPDGSSYFAKLLGTYETEIHPFIHDVMNKRYDVIVNVGSDDGYYAVGLVRKLNTKLIVFDLNKRALKQCEELANLNKIESEIIYNGKCTAADLLAIDFGTRGLIISDCEGDERIIFTKELASKLYQCDMIIELHLHLHPDLVEYMTLIFMHTHEIHLVDSIDDHIKATTYSYPELEDLSYAERYFIVEEREVFMQWMFLKTRANG